MSLAKTGLGRRIVVCVVRKLGREEHWIHVWLRCWFVVKTWWIIFIWSVKIVFTNISRIVSRFVNEKTRQLLLKTEIKETNWPFFFITHKIIDKINLLVQFHIQWLVIHSCFVNARIHIEFVHEIASTFECFLLAYSHNGSLIALLLPYCFAWILLSKCFDFFIFQLILWHIWNLNYCPCILNQTLYAIKTLLTLLKAVSFH